MTQPLSLQPDMRWRDYVLLHKNALCRYTTQGIQEFKIYKPTTIDATTVQHRATVQNYTACEGAV